MICARHAAIAMTTDDHGHPLCSACFQEAKAMAEAKQLERRIEAMRLSSASALMKRLGGRP